MTQQSAQTGSYPFSATLRGSLVPTLVVGLVTSVVLALVRGVDGGLSAVVGVVIAVVFFASGLLVMDKVVKDKNPVLFMAVGMSVYFAQVLVLLGVLVVARRVDSLDSRAAGIAMLVAVVTWQVAQMRAWRNARVPVYDTPAEGAPTPGSPADQTPRTTTTGEGQ
ncbi:hypothetical protein GCM10009867_10860 [Pedococcus aerophilus]|uniref:ATP synthase protein I n=1 Tax=Pedococcus aerophilus TaxID=436356 RepID=A0ABN3UJ82_9MICO